MASFNILKKEEAKGSLLCLKEYADCFSYAEGCIAIDHLLTVENFDAGWYDKYLESVSSCIRTMHVPALLVCEYGGNSEEQMRTSHSTAVRTCPDYHLFISVKEHIQHIP